MTEREYEKALFADSRQWAAIRDCRRMIDSFDRVAEKLNRIGDEAGEPLADRIWSYAVELEKLSERLQKDLTAWTADVGKLEQQIAEFEERRFRNALFYSGSHEKTWTENQAV